jgi:hypothetical protein
MSDANLGSLCCLLHNLIPGGSARQWIRLLGRHVDNGGEATIVAPPGALSKVAREAGLELIEVEWSAVGADLAAEPWPRVAEHDVAIVHWDYEVMHTLAPALEACGRAALVVHQAPTALGRWFGDEFVETARPPIELAARHPAATVLVRGEYHRQRLESAFGVAPGALQILPVAIPLPPRLPPRPLAAPHEVLALMRLSPEKAPIARLAVELVATRLAAGEPCHLTIAGDGPWRGAATDLCETRLQAGAWTLEPAPDDPIARLAAADVVVAQGGTTLEAAALGRPTVVAREAGKDSAAGAVLTPATYDVAARDPFGFPAVTCDITALWQGLLALDADQLDALRDLVARHNSADAAYAALGEALKTTAPGLPAWR